MLFIIRYCNRCISFEGHLHRIAMSIAILPEECVINKKKILILSEKYKFLLRGEMEEISFSRLLDVLEHLIGVLTKTVNHYQSREIGGKSLGSFCERRQNGNKK